MSGPVGPVRHGDHMNGIEALHGCDSCADTIRGIYANFRDNDWPTALQDHYAAVAALDVIHGHHGAKAAS